MKVELKNVKYAGFASHETHCFEATVYINGERAGTVGNEGQGGPHHYSPHDLESVLDGHAKTLPPYDASDLYGEPAGTKMCEHCAETLIGFLVNDWLYTRDLTRRLARVMLFTKKGETALFSVGFRQPQALGAIVRDKGMLAAFAHRHSAETILNALPFEQALRIFRAAS